jgi:hypothetical protein
MQKRSIDCRLNLNSAFSDFLLSELLINTLFEGAAMLVHRVNSIPSKYRGGETYMGS